VVADAGIVDQDVDATVEGAHRLVFHGGDLAVVGDVGGDGNKVEAGFLRFGRGGEVRFFPPAGDGHPRAGLCQSEGERLAESLVAAGDEGGLAVETERGCHAWRTFLWH
jgi:hypothetical protein